MLYLFEHLLPQALTTSLVQSIWQALVIWSIIQLVQRIAPLTSASRYYLNAAGVITQLILFITIFIAALVQPAPAAMPSAENLQYLNIDQQASPWYAFIQIPAILAPYLSILYVFVLAMLSTRFSSSVVHTKLLRKSPGRKAPIDFRLLTDHYASVLNIGKKVQVFVNHNVLVPLTIGYVKPMILLPAAMVNNLSIPQVEAIILHELIHIRRYDYIVNIVIEVAGMLLFFNPFIRHMTAQAKLHREISCDDTVVQFKIDRRAYAEALLNCSQLPGLQLAMAASGENSFHLLHRIRRILSKQEEIQRGGLLKWIPALAFVLALSIIGVGAGFLKSANSHNLSSVVFKEKASSSSISVQNGLSAWFSHKLAATTPTPASGEKLLALQPSLAVLQFLYNPNWDLFKASESYAPDQTAIGLVSTNATGFAPQAANAEPQLEIADKWATATIDNNTRNSYDGSNYSYEWNAATLAGQNSVWQKLPEGRYRIISGEISHSNTGIAIASSAIAAECDANTKSRSIVADHQARKAGVNAADEMHVQWITEDVFVMSEQEQAQFMQLQELKFREAAVIIEKQTKLLEEQLHALSKEDLDKAEIIIRREIGKVQAASRKLAELKGRISIRNIDINPAQRTDAENLKIDAEISVPEKPVLLRKSEVPENNEGHVPQNRVRKVTISVTL